VNCNPCLFHLSHFAKTAGGSPSSERSMCAFLRVRVAHSMHRVHPHSSQNVLVCRFLRLACQHNVHLMPYCRPSKVRLLSPGGNSAITCVQPSMRLCASWVNLWRRFLLIVVSSTANSARTLKTGTSLSSKKCRGGGGTGNFGESHTEIAARVGGFVRLAKIWTVLLLHSRPFVAPENAKIRSAERHPPLGRQIQRGMGPGT
jgi:hypothetical protein